MDRDQRIRDPIHDLIKFSTNNSEDQLLWNLIQTPQFQRLRRIKQLGFSDFVFPGASHSRFSHSLGAMQMARRMVSKFLGIGDSGINLLMRRATLCAVLLHDIGHGPFSHTFEHISLGLGVRVEHEEITQKLITETEIAEILKSDIDGLFDQIVNFLQQEPGANPYSKIVSSQLDADRLDFLMRDRYFAGVRFGSIDLEWLFDSLVLEEVGQPDGDRSHIFYFKEKGLVVAEDFLTAYKHLYSTVYYHKTTRAIEAMLKEILMLTFDSEENRSRLAPGNDLLRYFEAAPILDLNLFMALDDTSILGLVKQVAGNSNFGDASILAKRFLQRDLFKVFVPPGDAKFKLLRFESKLKDEGVNVILDTPPPKRHKIYYDSDYMDNIFLWDRTVNEPIPISKISMIARALSEIESAARFYFFGNGEERSKAIEIWNSL